MQKIMSTYHWIILGITLCIINITNSAPDPRHQNDADNEQICIASDQITALQSYLQKLTDNAQEMKLTMAEHVNDTETDPVVMATWLNLIKLHLTVNNMYDNFTQWVEGHSMSHDDVIDDTQEVTNSASNEQSQGFAIFNLWAQLHKLKVNVTQMQLKSKYYELKLGNLTILQKDIADLTKKMDKVERGQIMYTNTLADIKQQVRNMDSKINRSESVKSSMTGQGTGHTTSDDGDGASLVSLQETITGLMDRLATVQNRTNFMAAEIERLKTHQTSEGNTERALPRMPAITFANCNDERRHLVGNSCYFIPRLKPTDELYTWWDARHYCKHMLGEGADLAAIESEQEMLDIINLLSNHFGGIQEIWLGGSDLQLEGTWLWSSNKQVLNEDTYDNWAHPPPYNTASNCMSMLRGYEWVDEPCFYERYPLCELQLQPE